MEARSSVFVQAEEFLSTVESNSCGLCPAHLRQNIRNFIFGILYIEELLEYGKLSQLRKVVRQLNTASRKIYYAISEEFDTTVAERLSGIMGQVAHLAGELMPHCDVSDDPNSPTAHHLEGIDSRRIDIVKICNGTFEAQLKAATELVPDPILLRSPSY